MPESVSVADMAAIWAAEQLWDWRVRMLFAAVCAVAALVCIGVHVAFNRKRADATDSRTRRWFGRVAVTLLVVTVAESAFFKDGLTTGILLATALVIGFLGLRTPGNCADIEADDSPGASEGDVA